MQPDDARLQDARAWLSKAELDLKAAAHEISAPAEALWGDVMFHAQQAAEKALKAFWRGRTCHSGRRITSRNSGGSVRPWTQHSKRLPTRRVPDRVCLEIPLSRRRY